ncbi:prepilin-type N-terminal cleavage/methylation domain-containing protein [Campylobacter hyointestinalis]|uniref:prepilin-type N-terminal cleavage/methylation domain-containing protein n=1 Tax=Campylobacter hyointestinalis TaxID=198 RepID=UPI000CE56903|nr:prepilin-type N-terminal cleavage/methylation domain-containing protein [Campylobacter hyointestinalis]PPB71446.1 hypothetical protein CDQ79_08260 [Campylobacter hyointestinalis subsp. hyointestinalis]PPB74553.1 hypothetical protein CDQ80_07175 [Campylobacter hyointestinalis subsp. hyointestinalis]PPB76202.1 hypothetical protein CDQ81_07715 [Campylobacter hyointestinalis subsp. hyointestinalis]PPB77794.1 hypothetical protein CDQ82_06155 [Campylobacter hyointestinalis subsp. hyointestinalis]
MKKAFSILELILAIVIIAIAVSVVPSIVLSTSQSNSQALLQEAVLATKTILTNEMSKEFEAYDKTKYASRDGLKHIKDQRNIYEFKDKEPENDLLKKLEIQSASEDKNILSLGCNITRTYSSDRKIIEVKTTYEGQTIVLTGYSFNIGKPKAGQIEIENSSNQ